MKGIICHHFNANFKLIKKIIKLNKLISQNTTIVKRLISHTA